MTSLHNRHIKPLILAGLDGKNWHLQDYVNRGGSVEAGLKTYVGAAAFENDSGYGSRVLAEYRRLKQVSAGQRVPTSTPVMASNTPAPAKAPAAESGNITIKIAPHNEIAGL